MKAFAQILDRARKLGAARGSPTLVMIKLDEADGGPVTLNYSEVVDLEVLLGGLVAKLESLAAGSGDGSGRSV